MTSTRIEWTFNGINRASDLADLAEVLFPDNRNQQHAFLVIWLALKWAPAGLVPNLADIARQHEVTRRTLDRVRAKMRRLGLIDHISRFNARFGYQEGWALSSRFDRSLKKLADKVSAFKDLMPRSREKDLLLLQMARARRDVGLQAGDSIGSSTTNRR